MSAANYQKVTFILSAASVKQLPLDEGIEVAFVGRSNAGKSSALNALTNQKKLAKISKTPGRTQLINLFALTEDKRLVDLPGYGFAKVPEEIKRKWQLLLDTYLKNRHCLQGLILLMDIRHPMQTFDRQMIEWAAFADLPIHILLTKADKLSKGARNNALFTVQKELKILPGKLSVQLFSSQEQIGREELIAHLDSWFDFE